MDQGAGRCGTARHAGHAKDHLAAGRSHGQCDRWARRRICRLLQARRRSFAKKSSTRPTRGFPSWRRTARSLETETDARGRRFDLVPIAEAPRSAVPGGRGNLLPFVRELLSCERRRDCSCLRHRRGRCGGRNLAARISGTAGRVPRTSRFVPRRRRDPLHNPAGTALLRLLNTRIIVALRSPGGL